MGNETSLPEDVVGEPGLDPPSQIPPRTTLSNGKTHARPGKALKQMFHRSTHTADPGKDASRVAAENGYFDSDMNTTASVSTSSQSSSRPYFPQQQQQQYNTQQLYSEGAAAASLPPPPPNDLSPPQSYPVVGVMYSKDSSSANVMTSTTTTTTSSPRKLGQGLISSMRHMHLGGGGGSSRPSAAPVTEDLVVTPPPLQVQPREAEEWAKGWDEDEDDDEDEEEENEQHANLKLPARPVSGDLLGIHQDASVPPPSRPGMDAAHSSTIMMTPAAAVTSLGGGVVTPSSLTPPTRALHEANAKVPPQAQPPWDVDQALPSQRQPPPEEQYEKPNVEMFLPMLRVLGKGSFGKVVLVQKRRGNETGQLYAMKILRKTHLLKRRQIERTRTERKVLSVVDHPFIMKLHYAFQSDDKLYLVLDYCPGGELFFHLSRFRRFPERVARFYAAELLLAIGHLHKRGIIYRDLKPENVLLDADGHVKLGDFGLAKAGIRHACEGAISMCGTPEYMAPEVLSQAGHGFCVDYWGLGMLVYEMMTGLPPWYTTDRAKLFRRLKSSPLDIPTYFSAQAAECIGHLLVRNPRRRLGAAGIRQAMEHDFFRTINWRALYARRTEAPIRPCEGWAPPEAAGAPGQDALEKATANFDSNFTRMPVHSDGSGSAPETSHDNAGEGELEEQLHADSFVGFTFDQEKEGQPSVSPQRPRSHNAGE